MGFPATGDRSAPLCLLILAARHRCDIVSLRVGQQNVARCGPMLASSEAAQTSSRRISFASQWGVLRNWPLGCRHGSLLCRMRADIIACGWARWRQSSKMARSMYDLALAFAGPLSIPILCADRMADTQIYWLQCVALAARGASHALLVCQPQGYC